MPYQAEPGDSVEKLLRAIGGDRNAIVPWELNTRALELAGYLPGDVVLVDLNATPKPGDAVYAQLYDWPGRKAQTVMRIFERAGPINLLVAKTTDPGLAQPHIVDGERVVIKGVLMPHRLRPGHQRPSLDETGTD